VIRINLLPHREEKRKARRTQFFALTGMILVLAALIWFFGFLTIGRWIASQDEKNAFLKREIVVLDKDIAEIKRLKEQTEIMLSRNRVIESLQATRAETVHLFSELARNVPEGVYLKTAKQTGRKVTLAGYAQANARVSELMQKLDASPLLEHPILIEIKSASVGRARLSEFMMTVEITQQTTTADKKVDGKAGPAKPGAKQ
jgi:type IV pilus assembly protein PilN